MLGIVFQYFLQELWAVGEID